MLSIEKLQVEFFEGDSRVTAVNDVNLTIRRGEIFCLVGESGSGKSVTALSIMKLLPNNASISDASRITLINEKGDSSNLLKLAENSLQTLRGSHIAMIFQEPMTSLNPVLTVGEQISEAIRIRWPQITDEEVERKTIEALRQVQIENPRQRCSEYPHRLSGGQRQRVMIAMAVACEPSLLIADEPTTALDVTVQAGILSLIVDLQKRNKMSVLFITHDLGVVAQIASRVAVMEKGRIVEQGQVDQVLLKPAHTYTKKLVDALPENLLAKRRVSYRFENSIGKPSGDEYIRILDVHVNFPIRAGIFQRTSGSVAALNNVSLSISQGAVVALVGESGSGKTTLGKMLLGLQAKSSGDVFFHGEKLHYTGRWRQRQLATKMQYVFQDPASSLNPRLSVATTLIEPMSVHKLGENYDHRVHLAERLLEDMQLSKMDLWRFPHQFSGGQRQRIGIARALCLTPEFIVCDEITSALDVSVQADILALLLDLRKNRNLTLLFISHDIGVVEYISDQTAVMRRGQIVEFGATEQVCQAPDHPYTQRLIAAVPKVNSGSRIIN